MTTANRAPTMTNTPILGANLVVKLATTPALEIGSSLGVYKATTN